MHEVSLASGILKIVEDAAAQEHFSRVTLLRLEAGVLSAVDVRALRFALEAMTHNTCLQDARIEIETPSGLAWCMPCGVTVEISARGDPCMHCGGFQLQPTGGTELRVLEMMVEDQ